MSLEEALYCVRFNMLAVSSDECRARVVECLRHAANERMPMELRESWFGLAEMCEDWSVEAEDNMGPIGSRPMSRPVATFRHRALAKMTGK